MAIGEGLTAAKLAFEIGNKAVDQLRHPKVDGEAVRMSVVTMLDHVLSAKNALNDAQEEVCELRRQLGEQNAVRALEA